MKKKITIIVIAIILILLIVFNIENINKHFFYMYMRSLDYDVKIEYMPSAYDLSVYSLINLDQKIEYTITENSIPAETRPWIKCRITKETITEQRKQEILSYYNYESDELTQEDVWGIVPYKIITFKDKTIIIK